MFLFGKKDYFNPGPDGTVPVIAFVGKSTTVPVYDVPAMVGRVQGQADVVINDATISRQHFYISTYENKFTVTDQGSTSGTVINGEVLEPGVPYYLSEGDKIKIGKLDFVCHINKERTGKKLKLPIFIDKDSAGNTSEMSKADIKAAAAAAEAKTAAETELLSDPAADVVKDAEAITEAADEADAAAAIVKDAELAAGYGNSSSPTQDPVIKLMPDPVLEEDADDIAAAENNVDKNGLSGERASSVQTEDPVVELEEMGLEFGDDSSADPEISQRLVQDEKPEAEDAGKPENAITQEERSGVAGTGGSDIEPEEREKTIDVMRGEKARVKGPKFVYYSGSTAVETFVVTATPFVIGRAKCDYTPGAAGVSRRHCFIDRNGSTYYITDLESTNGVWINGRKIKPYNRTALVNGDIIGLGDRVYKYEQNN